jgi:GT2 family glycosyltransferase
MIIAIVSVACNPSDGITRLVASARSSRHDVCFRLFLHSHHPMTMQACDRLAVEPGVTYYPYGENRGLSKSWNEGMLDAYGAGADVVIIVNDDVHFSPSDVDKLAEKAARHADRYIVSCAGYHGRFGRTIPSHGYACFAINPIALRRLGCFDENFFPAYCEDQDYAYRASLAGLCEENCADTMVYHLGSAAIFSDAVLRQQNCYTQGQNMQYYQRKWGGPAGQEIFTAPFNDSRFGCYIAPEQRHVPYGTSYDRVDREIVKV